MDALNVVDLRVHNAEITNDADSLDSKPTLVREVLNTFRIQVSNMMCRGIYRKVVAKSIGRKGPSDGLPTSGVS